MFPEYIPSLAQKLMLCPRLAKAADAVAALFK